MEGILPNGKRVDLWKIVAFDGMTMTTQNILNRFTITTLQGIVADQSALHGILNHIRDLGLPLLKVECLPPPELKSKEYRKE